MTSATPPRIFLSYARADGSALAQSLRERLDSLRLSLWQDLHAMQSGDWRAQIWNAIEGAEHLVMVLTRGAIASAVVREEWHHARKTGKEVSPILADPTLGYADLPAWMRADHIYRFDPRDPATESAHDFLRLVDVLKGPSLQRRMPTIARTAGDRFVPRPHEMNALRAQLLDSRGEALGGTVALTGSGGMGKTTLALALVHDPVLQMAYHHGQILVELGQTPNLAQALAGATAALTGKPALAGDVVSASRELAEAIGERRVLMLVDDAWDRAHLAPFLESGANCARLVTTRDESVLPRGVQINGAFQVDQMSPEQALALIGAGLPEDEALALSSDLLALGRQLGRCALLLELANGVLFSSHHDGVSLVDSLADARRRLERAGVVAFDIRDTTSRSDAYSRTIDASLSLLNDNERTRFAELAIFPEDTDVPWPVIDALWLATAALQPEDSRELLGRLTRKSLLKRSAQLGAGASARLHDVVRQHLRDQFRADPVRLAAVHGALVDALESAPNLPARNGAARRYVLARLPWHAHEAGNRAKLDQLLLSPSWMQSKVEGLGSPLPLLDDYERFANGPMQIALGRTLRLAAGTIARNPDQLIPQLLGRLPITTPGAPGFRDDAIRHLPRPTLAPHHQSLTAPGVEVSRFEGHAGCVRALVVLPDGRLASGSDDGTIRLWSLRPGAQSSRIDQGSRVSALCVLRNGLLASASSGRFGSGRFETSIRLWDPETGLEVRRLEGHTEGVNALCLLPDGRLASGSSDGTVRFWDLALMEETARIAIPEGGHSQEVGTLCVLPGDLLAVGEHDFIHLWALAHGRFVRGLEGHRSAVGLRALCTLHDGCLVSAGGELLVWSADAETIRRKLDVAGGGVSTLCVVGDGVIATGAIGKYDFDTMIRLRHVDSDDELGCLKGHTATVWSLCRLPNDQLASGSDDCTVRIWDLAAARIAPAHGTTPNPVDWICPLPSGLVVTGSKGRLYAPDKDCSPRLWDPKTGAELGRASRSQLSDRVTDKDRAYVASLGVNPLTFVPDRNAFWNPRDLPRFSPSDAAPSTAPRLGQIATEAGRVIRVYCVLADGCLAVVFGGQSVNGTSDYDVMLYEPHSGRHLAKLEGHNREINSLCLLPGGHLCSGSDDKTIRLWDIERQAEIARFELDAGVTCMIASSATCLLAGDDLGRLHWLDVLV